MRLPLPAPPPLERFLHVCLLIIGRAKWSLLQSKVDSVTEQGGVCYRAKWTLLQSKVESGGMTLFDAVAPPGASAS